MNGKFALPHDTVCICSDWDGNLLLHILDFYFWALKWLKGKYMLMSVSSRHLGYWRYEILAQTNPIYVVICQKVQFFCKPLYVTFSVVYAYLLVFALFIISSSFPKVFGLRDYSNFNNARGWITHYSFTANCKSLHYFALLSMK